MEYSQPLAQDKHGRARTVAAALFGGAVELHPYHSNGCDVFRLEFPDGRGAKILKVPRADPAELIREQKIMRALRAQGLGEVPPLDYTQDTNPVEGIAYTVMPFFPGGGIWDLSAMPAAQARPLYERMGRFVGRVSRLRVAEIEGAWTADERQREGAHPVLALAEERLARHPRRSARFDGLLRRWRERSRDLSGFCHGDGPQFLTDGGDTLAAIDWAGAGAGPETGDLGGFLFGHHYWVDRQRRQGKPYHAEWRTWFLAGYGAERPLTRDRLLEAHRDWGGDFLAWALDRWAQGIEESEEWLDFIEAESEGFPDEFLRQVPVRLA